MVDEEVKHLKMIFMHDNALSNSAMKTYEYQNKMDLKNIRFVKWPPCDPDRILLKILNCKY